VKPNSAADPGLVYDNGFNDWLAFLCGTTTAVGPASCTALENAGFSLDASDLNEPSIAVGDLAGVQTVKRKVTNVGSSAATYNAAVTGMAGITTVVSPSSLTLAPDETKAFTVAFTRTTATLNAYVGGQLTWTDGTHAVRSPIVVRPVALAAPAAVSGTGGPIGYQVTFGYDGAFTASARGLVAPTITPGTVPDDPGDSFAPGGPGTVAIPVTIAAGTTHARFSLFDADVARGATSTCTSTAARRSSDRAAAARRRRRSTSGILQPTRTRSTSTASRSPGRRRSSCTRGSSARRRPAT
jgi:hypothetical protein